MASLSRQLSEAQGKQEALAQALATARQAMEIYQETARRDVRVKSEIVCSGRDVRVKVAIMCAVLVMLSHELFMK